MERQPHEDVMAVMEVRMVPETIRSVRGAPGD